MADRKAEVSRSPHGSTPEKKIEPKCTPRPLRLYRATERRTLEGKTDDHRTTLAVEATQSKTEIYGTGFAVTADDLGSYCSHVEQRFA